eukprot:6174200-Prymnesium_polylepis.1
MGPQNRKKREQSATKKRRIREAVYVTSASTATRRYLDGMRGMFHLPTSAKGLTTPNTCILDGRVSRCVQGMHPTDSSALHILLQRVATFIVTGGSDDMTDGRTARVCVGFSIGHRVYVAVHVLGEALRQRCSTRTVARACASVRP